MLADNMARLTIDLEDLRDKIAAMDKPGDNSWRELSISARIRVLLRERIQQLEALKEAEKDD